MKKQPHSFTRRIHHWWYCRYCGLVALNNAATRAAIKAGCAS